MAKPWPTKRIDLEKLQPIESRPIYERSHNKCFFLYSLAMDLTFSTVSRPCPCPSPRPLTLFHAFSGTKFWKNLILILLIFCLAGCQQGTSYEDFREKGRAKTRSLIAELKGIRTKDQLILRSSNVMEAFDQVAKLAEKVKLYQMAHPQEESPPLTQVDRELSEQLQLEIFRVCRLEGGREIILKCTARKLRNY